jgi:branched-subunit amino acid aminotransferase/4-amino-4-deoxychorismate lyase
MTAHAAPPRPAPPWKLVVFPMQVEAKDRFQGHKTVNRLVQVMAATHAREADADEALIVNTRGWIGEGSMSNFFWIRDGSVNTTQLLPSVLPGVTRAAVLELCRGLKIPVEQGFTNRDQLTQRCEGVFLTLTSRGIVEAESVDGKPLRRSLISRQLQEEFEALVQRECA